VDSFIKEEPFKLDAKSLIVASPELLKYLSTHYSEKGIDEDNSPLEEFIKINFKEDKRFTKEVNELIRRELAKRFQELRVKIFQKLQKKHQSNTSIHLN
jgi:hypothetical protein